MLFSVDSLNPVSAPNLKPNANLPMDKITYSVTNFQIAFTLWMSTVSWQQRCADIAFPICVLGEVSVSVSAQKFKHVCVPVTYP